MCIQLGNEHVDQLDRSESWDRAVLVADGDLDHAAVFLHASATGQARTFPVIEPELCRTSDLAESGATATLVAERIVADVAMLLRDDEGPCSQDTLERAGLTPDEARVGAIARMALACVALELREIGDGVIAVTHPTRADLTAPCILVADIWSEFDDLDGQVVIAAPTSRDVFVCGSADDAALESLRKRVASAHSRAVADPASNGRPLTTCLMTVGDDGDLRAFDAYSDATATATATATTREAAPG